MCLILKWKERCSVRVFRSTYKVRSGKTKQTKKWYIELKDHNYIVRRFVAFTDKSQSELLGRQIERLVNYKVAGEQPDPQLSRWLTEIPEKMRNKFVEIGLLDSCKAAAGRLLTEHVEDFRVSLDAKGNTSEHVKKTVSRLRRVIEGCKFKSWTDISASKVQRFLAGLRNNENGISAQTFNYYLKATKQFCRWMVDNRRASENPLSHLKAINAEADKRHPRRSLELDEVRLLLETTYNGPKRMKITGPERAMLYRLAIETGLRLNELRSLTVDSFDFEACTVTVNAAYSKRRRQDTLPLKPDTANMLKEFLRGKLPHASALKVPRRRYEAALLRADLEAAGIPYVDGSGRYADFHSLRHTTGSLLALSGVHPKVAQSIMRHSDINLTMSHYTHILRGQESKAVAALPDLSLPSKERQQAAATGTDGGINSAEYLAPKGGKPYNSVDFDGQKASKLNTQQISVKHAL